MIDKIALGNTGKKRSMEFKKNLSIARKGDNNPSAKLTWEKVSQIRELLNSDITQKEISKLFNIQRTIISRIKNNKIWKIS